jgi:hypothetical protein
MRQLTGLPQPLPAHAETHLDLQQQAVQAVSDNQLDVLCTDRKLGEALQQARRADAAAQVHPSSSTSSTHCTFDAMGAAVSLTDAFATGQPELLAAVSGPRDLLLPPAQQKVQPTAATDVAAFQAACHYLGTVPGPDCMDLYQDSERRKQREQQQQRTQSGLRSAQQAQASQQAAAAAEAELERHWDMQQQSASTASAFGLGLLAPAPQSDVSRLMLQSPCPVEALSDPLVWWRWQQALLELQCCDVCGSMSKDVSAAWSPCCRCCTVLGTHCSIWLLFKELSCERANCQAALCCAVLCCAVLCCAVLCCAVLCCAVLSHQVPDACLLTAPVLCVYVLSQMLACRDCRQAAYCSQECLEEDSNHGHAQFCGKLVQAQQVRNVCLALDATASSVCFYWSTVRGAAQQPRYTYAAMRQERCTEKPFFVVVLRRLLTDGRPFGYLSTPSLAAAVRFLQCADCSSVQQQLPCAGAADAPGWAACCWRLDGSRRAQQHVRPGWAHLPT